MTPSVRRTVLDQEVERWGGVGAIYGVLRADAWSGRDWATGADPGRSVEVMARVQARVVEGSRLGIPALLVEEAPHGHLALGSRLLPVNLAAGATWDPDLVEAAATVIGAEVRARGANVALVSGLDILRDPRWGRAEETFGEDPLLASLFVRASVRGMRRTDGLGVVLKHLAGQGAAIGGRNGSGAPIGWRELAELHLQPARAGIEEGALGVMAAYNDIDGVPCVANARLLTGILRERWGFEGIVMSDLGAIDRLVRGTVTLAAAGAVALRAGVDMSMCDEAFSALEQALDEGLVSESDIDRAVRRVLALKIRLGLLDDPRTDTAAPSPVPAASVAGVDVAASTLTLLQDPGGVLPLARLPERVAVIGPNADDVACLLGDYVPPLAPGVGVSALDAIRARHRGTVTHAPGSGRTASVEGGLEGARRAAADADLVVLVVGTSGVRGYDDDFQANGAGSLGGRLPAATTGEGFDVAEVELPLAQGELVVAVAQARRPGVPLIGVVVSGRPLGIAALAEHCDVVIYAWYPGPDGGHAIAELVLGEREPTGRLPVSLPRSSGTLPVAYDERIEVTRRYVDSEARALFPFGAGLGHTRWSLGAPVASATAVTPDELGGLDVRVSLTNEGERAGGQVVQLYARVLLPGIVPRRAILVGFERARLEAGASAEVTVLVRGDALAGLGLGEVIVDPPDPAIDGLLELWCSIDGPARPDERVTGVRVRPRR